MSLAAPAAAQKKDAYSLSGTVTNSGTKGPVTGGVVLVLEAARKAAIGADGTYYVAVPRAGQYTIIVKADTLKTVKTPVTVDKNVVRNFTMDPLITRGRGITITARREIQKLSSHTMSREQMKEVPASLGDSVSALTSLPGVSRTGGDLFGPIVIRGGDFRGVTYLVDDIPLPSAQHYGGLHSVINSNLITDVNLFASAFPAEFGSATSSVISINTTDEVKTFSGYTDISILSATALIQTPIYRNEGGSISLGSPFSRTPRDDDNVGYMIASGRIGYIDFIVLPLLQAVMGQKINIVPRYWDYQFKAKIKLTPDHSITIMAIGSSDYLKFVNKQTGVSQGSDPLLYNLRAKTDQTVHGQGLYYTYQPSDKFQNRLTFYTSLKSSYSSIDFPMPGVNVALKGVEIDSRPYLFGVKDKFKAITENKILQVQGGVDYAFYYFRARGRTLADASYSASDDLTDTSRVPVILNQNTLNHRVGGFIEFKVTHKGFTFMPSYRSDFFKRSGQTTWDPRLLMSYEFPTKTTISVAGGKYSYFMQTNPSYFNIYPQYSKIGRSSPAEWAFHRVAGIEQVIDQFTLKIEGYFNDFFNQTRRYLHYTSSGRPTEVMNTGRIRAYGAEIMLQKNIKENENGVFGWASYTYTRSLTKSGLPPFAGLYGIAQNQLADPYGHVWLTYSQEQNHSLKLILGYILGRHTITGKFQLFTSQPYTPIVSSQEDMTYASSNPGLHRYIPLFGRPNSRRFPPNHRLDVRYSNKAKSSWGYVSWYIEIINIYNYNPVVYEAWNYYIPFVQSGQLHARNPKRSATPGQINFIPNLGVEVKF